MYWIFFSSTYPLEVEKRFMWWNNNLKNLKKFSEITFEWRMWRIIRNIWEGFKKSGPLYGSVISSDLRSNLITTRSSNLFIILIPLCLVILSTIIFDVHFQTEWHITDSSFDLKFYHITIDSALGKNKWQSIPTVKRMNAKEIWNNRGLFLVWNSKYCVI